MQHCRICNATTNLKYSAQQLKNLIKRQKRRGLILTDATTTGNICLECDDHLCNFDFLLNESSGDEATHSNNNNNGCGESLVASSTLRDGEKTVLVDDDLIDIFHKKVKQHKKKKQQNNSRMKGQQEKNDVIVEILSSRENSPVVELNGGASGLAKRRTREEQGKHQVLAIIDLETEESNEAPTSAMPEDQATLDSQMAVAHGLKTPTKQSTNPPNSPKRQTIKKELLTPSPKSSTLKQNRQKHLDKKFRVIARFNLVSSDSEDDEYISPQNTRPATESNGLTNPPQKSLMNGGKLTSPLRPGHTLLKASTTSGNVSAMAPNTPQQEKASTSPDMPGQSPDTPNGLNMSPGNAALSNNVRSLLQGLGLVDHALKQTKSLLTVDLVDESSKNSSDLNRTQEKMITPKPETKLRSSSVTGKKKTHLNGTSFSQPRVLVENLKWSSSSEKSRTCQYSQTSLPDSKSLTAHETEDHKGLKCPVCDGDYPSSQKLVHHMRSKHRTYQGDLLREHPRRAPDSEMTIRLRYNKETLYYECQLCGSIDTALRDHKNHLEEHKQLMETLDSEDSNDNNNGGNAGNADQAKELRCYVCKEYCGPQYLQLCRHMLKSHKLSECKPHLRELTDLGTGRAARMKLDRLARVFQINKRKAVYYECKQCKHVEGALASFMNHYNSTHDSDKSNKAENSKVKEKVVPKESKGNSASCKRKRNDEPQNKKLRKEKKKEDRKHTAMVIMGKRLKEEGDRECRSRAADCTRPFRKCLPTTVTNSHNVKNKNNPKISNNTKKKPSKKALQAKIIKVKVKPPLRRVPLIKFICPICAAGLKGFCAYNQHLMKEHAGDEFQKCPHCPRLYTSKEKMKKHQKRDHLIDNSKRKSSKSVEAEPRPVGGKRKRSRPLRGKQNHSATGAVKRPRRDRSRVFADEPNEIKVEEPGTAEDMTIEPKSDPAETVQYDWLGELLDIARKRLRNGAEEELGNPVNAPNDCDLQATTTAIVNCQEKHQDEQQQQQHCMYCARLFLNTALEYQTHLSEHQERKDKVILKRSDIH